MARPYLMARFRLGNTQECYLLEIDTSDNKKQLSTQVVRFRARYSAFEGIDMIVRAAAEG